MDGQIKVLSLRRDDVCGGCKGHVAAGERAGWDRSRRQVLCTGCLGLAVAASADETEEPLPIAAGLPGDSLDREYARRSQQREDRIRGRFGRLGGVVLALTSEPQSTRAFATGAEGERRVAASLERLCGGEARFLHNRRLGPGKRAGDIDHVAVTRSGVYVIDAKHYRGAKVEVRRSGGFLSPRREQLMVRGRDRTKLVQSLVRQRDAVRLALQAESAPVTALFCFVGAEFRMFGASTIQDLPIRGLRGTGRLLRQAGALSAEDRDAVWERLARALPPA